MTDVLFANDSSAGARPWLEAKSIHRHQFIDTDRQDPVRGCRSLLHRDGNNQDVNPDHVLSSLSFERVQDRNMDRRRNSRIVDFRLRHVV